VKPRPRHTAAASLPARELPGLDPGWSRLVRATAADGTQRTWHCLDSRTRSVNDSVNESVNDSPGGPRLGTLVCVHGNPTWSYLWRGLLAAAPAGWRVVAVDHLGMGYSERVGAPQRLADRVHDLGAVLDALDVTGPVVTIAHDWGGSISLGWALAHRDQLAGIVLLNTAVSQPPGSPVPALIALARTPGVLRASCVTTPSFLRGTLRLAHPALPTDVRAGYLAPYEGAERREAIGDFVADIPLRTDHPSRPTLEAIAGGLSALADVPTLLLWGPRDPVFSDRYLRDLTERLPMAQVHRFEGAGHLVAEDRDIAAAVTSWLASALVPPPPTGPGGAAHRSPAGAGQARALWAALDDRAADQSPAIVELSGQRRTVSFADLDVLTRQLAAGLVASGVARGDRVALLVPPGVDLACLVYACWRIGAVIVLADAGLGLRGMSRALRGAGPSFLVGVPRALAAARALRWPGTTIAVGSPGQLLGHTLRATTTLDDLLARGRTAPGLPPEPGPDDEAAVLFTSGATGPAKGVVYRHRQLQAQRDLLVRAYGIGPADTLVAAFAPFALYGPALGIASVVPDMDVTAPATLTATALADAVDAVNATLVFSSPAALVNVAATAERLSERGRQALAGVRLLLSAGAPVPLSLLRTVATMMPGAELHTPYGMTEVLPVTDITLPQIEAAGTGDGVCVGRPLPGVQVALRPLDQLGRSQAPMLDRPGVTGEICIAAAHLKDRYDRLWLTDQASAGQTDDSPAWHRSGDVGHLDDDGSLWVEGRLVHLVTAASAVITPVGVEQRVQTLPEVTSAAVVGVGPVGTQVLVVVVTTTAAGHGPLASPALSAAVRGVAGVEVSAVLLAGALPVDIRHNSKIDRTRVAAWASQVLRGRVPRSGP
jgi:olefin beta-lactone synthetase